MSKYDSIINIDFKMKHPRMSIENRSFSFAPFSALAGFSELILEKSQEVTSKKVLDDDIKTLLDRKLKIISLHLKDKPLITITYFLDNGKSSQYTKITDKIKKIDFNNKRIVLDNNLTIKIADIIDIESNNYFDDLSL